MRILIYGAGSIGSIIAGKLVQNDYDTTVLARGNRYTEILNKGIVLKNIVNNKVDNIKINVINTLLENDIYDYIIVPVQNNQIDAILPVLENNKSENIVFMVNNPLGYEKWINSVGYNRIIIGFPSGGGERKDGIVNYFIGTGLAKLFQSTTFGELNGQKTQRLKKLYKIFSKSGFSPSFNNKMDWWQKTHVAAILPIGKALYRFQSDNYKLSKSYETVKKMVLGTRELFNILQNNGIKITPQKLTFYYLPLIIISKIWQIFFSTKIAEYAMAKHTITGKEEMDILERQFMTLNKNGNELKYYNSI